MLSWYHDARKSRAARVVLGFYRSEEHGKEALAEIRNGGYRRSAVILRTPDGGARYLHAGFGPRERLIFAITAAASVDAVLVALPNIPLWILPTAALIAFVAVWFGTLQMGLGIRDRVLRGYERFVLPGESLVAVEATEEEAAEVMATMRRIAQPSVFAVRPAPRFPTREDSEEERREPATMASLPDCAAQLAAGHVVDGSTRSESLLPLLHELEGIIEKSRADLAEAARLEYGITHDAEWLLDNAYLIRSHVADIRHNLPDNHNKILPVLASSNCQIRLRVYHLAAELVDDTGHRMAADGIVRFLNAYQETAPLTVAELWVFPLMLRLVLLQRLSRLSRATSRRQHEKEQAHFWSDRILNAGHRSPQQLEAMIAELEGREEELTPHFIERMSELLLQEESALAPIQNWIEKKTGQRLADIVHGEHGEEARDLLLISGAISSLRGLSELQYPKIVEEVSRMEAILREGPAELHARSDFETRDRSRRVVERVARQSKRNEWDVARTVVDLAWAAPEGTRERCVGYYLLDDGLPGLEELVNRRVPWRERRQRFLEAHATGLYLSFLALLTSGLIAIFLWSAYRSGVQSPWLLAPLGVLALFPGSELATFLLHSIVIWMMPPRVLPKMSFREGIPDDCRTLVVVPMMLLTPAAIRERSKSWKFVLLPTPTPTCGSRCFQISPMRRKKRCLRTTRFWAWR